MVHSGFSAAGQLVTLVYSGRINDLTLWLALTLSAWVTVIHTASVIPRLRASRHPSVQCVGFLVDQITKMSMNFGIVFRLALSITRAG